MLMSSKRTGGTSASHSGLAANSELRARKTGQTKTCPTKIEASAGRDTAEMQRLRQLQNRGRRRR